MNQARSQGGHRGHVPPPPEISKDMIFCGRRCWNLQKFFRKISAGVWVASPHPRCPPPKFSAGYGPGMNYMDYYFYMLTLLIVYWYICIWILLLVLYINDLSPLCKPEHIVFCMLYLSVVMYISDVNIYLVPIGDEPKHSKETGKCYFISVFIFLCNLCILHMNCCVNIIGYC